MASVSEDVGPIITLGSKIWGDDVLVAVGHGEVASFDLVSVLLVDYTNESKLIIIALFVLKIHPYSSE